MDYIHTWVRKLVSGSFTRRLRRALDGDTANAGSEYNDKLYAAVTVIERGYGSTWTHLLEDWLVSRTPSLRSTSHLTREYLVCQHTAPFLSTSRLSHS